jgi:hypothetical protein
MTACPSHELLQRLLADQLSDVEQKAASAHVPARGRSAAWSG